MKRPRYANRSALIAALHHCFADFTAILGNLAVPIEERHRCWVRVNRIQDLLRLVRGGVSEITDGVKS